MSVRQGHEHTKRQQVTLPHGNPVQLAQALSFHYSGGAKRITMHKLRGEVPERWAIEAVYDVWRDV